jgi:hypothetical protein
MNGFTPIPRTELKRITSTMMKTSSLAAFCLSVLVWAPSVQAQSVPPELKGDWTLDLETGEPAWLSVVEDDGRPMVYMRVYIGPDGP